MGRNETRVEKLETALDSEAARRHVLLAEDGEDRDACIRQRGYDPEDERHFYFVIFGA
jgi:hypothetical protein